MSHFLDTDISRNTAHVETWIGVFLVGAVVLFFGYIIRSSLESLTEAYTANTPFVQGEGVFSRVGNDVVPEGGKVSFVVPDVQKESTFIFVACFRDTHLVFARSIVGNDVSLVNDAGEAIGNASCIAELLKRTPVRHIETLSFEVE